MNHPNDLLIGEWIPTEKFNILDVRDFQNFPQYDTPPYVLRFNFSNIQEPIDFYGILIDMMGWNLPECRTDLLFSKIQVSKNGFQDIYYDKKGGTIGSRNNLFLKFDKIMKMISSRDVMFVTLFPMCSIHMITIEKVGFLSLSVIKKIPITQETTITNDNDNNNKLLKPTSLSDYWYLYTTLFIMILFLMISLLFMVINYQPQKRRYIVIRTKK